MAHRKIVVMGVSGSGKTTVGQLLAGRLGIRFVDADDVHPPANVAKMAAGVPLTDTDRRPWLRALRDELERSESVVVACSALARSHRDVLRQAGDVAFVFLDVDRDSVVDRVTERPDHFMKSGMVDSQFRTLERPDDDELDVLTVDGTQATTYVVDVAVTRIGGG